MTFVGNVLRIAVALVMVVGVIAAGYLIFVNTNINLSFGNSSSSNATKVKFTIKPNETIDTIADNLQKQGIIDSPFWFRTRLKLLGADTSLKAGDFQVTPGMDTDALIETLTTSPLEQGVAFTVIEGVRLEEIADKLSSEGIVDRDRFLQLAGTPEGAATFSDEFLTASGRPAEQDLEGYLFPDTYEIEKNEGDNSETVIRTMLDTMEAKFTPEMRQVIAERNLSVHQVLTIASIVQREGQVKEELPRIAAVFWNRLNNEMRLDADPTIQYALGAPGEWWPQLFQDDLETDSPYNTYRVSTMPPGPICNPGLDAISAAVYPEASDYLFFVADPNANGAHLFAKTLEEHERNRVLVGNR